VRENILTNKGKNKFKFLTLETAINGILEQLKETRLQDHYKEFNRKYLGYRNNTT